MLGKRQERLFGQQQTPVQQNISLKSISPSKFDDQTNLKKSSQPFHPSPLAVKIFDNSPVSPEDEKLLNFKRSPQPAYQVKKVSLEKVKPKENMIEVFSRPV
jgi:hypothetical protein